jgi:hypothetical protein
MEYRQEREAAGKKEQRTGCLLEGVQGRGGGTGRKEGEAHKQDRG